MQHALEHADDDERGCYREGAVHHIEQHEAAADATGRDEQHGATADAVGDAADEWRRQQLATGIAAEQQADEFDRDACNLARPQRKERHENAVRHGSGEEQDHSDPGGNGARPNVVMAEAKLLKN